MAESDDEDDGQFLADVEFANEDEYHQHWINFALNNRRATIQVLMDAGEWEILGKYLELFRQYPEPSKLIPRRHRRYKVFKFYRGNYVA
jgi:hypothetical protein